VGWRAVVLLPGGVAAMGVAPSPAAGDEWVPPAPVHWVSLPVWRAAGVGPRRRVSPGCRM